MTNNQRITDFVQSQFPSQFLIPVSAFAKLTGESYGGCRNRISAGTFPLKLVKCGVRNYVAIFDVIDHLVRLADGKEVTPAQAQATEQEEKQNGRRSKYGEAAKARAAAARAARAAKREARINTLGGVE